MNLYDPQAVAAPGEVTEEVPAVRLDTHAQRDALEHRLELRRWARRVDGADEYLRLVDDADVEPRQVFALTLWWLVVGSAVLVAALGATR